MTKVNETAQVQCEEWTGTRHWLVASSQAAGTLAKQQATSKAAAKGSKVSVLRSASSSSKHWIGLTKIYNYESNNIYHREMFV